MATPLPGHRRFTTDYPSAQGHLFYAGTKRYRYGNIEVVPLDQGLRELGTLLR